jgi:calmodulin
LGPFYAVSSLPIYLIFPEYKEAFALFDKKGTGAVPRETLGDLLRALGQNPTQAEVADIVASAPREGK